MNKISKFKGKKTFFYGESKSLKYPLNTQAWQARRAKRLFAVNILTKPRCFSSLIYNTNNTLCHTNTCITPICMIQCKNFKVAVSRLWYILVIYAGSYKHIYTNLHQDIIYQYHLIATGCSVVPCFYFQPKHIYTHIS